MNNPARNGVLMIFDNLSKSMNWNDAYYRIARAFLKNSLVKASEADAYKYLLELDSLLDKVLQKCSMKT